MLTKKEYQQLLNALDKQLDEELADAVQATTKAIKEGKDTVGRNEDQPRNGESNGA